MEFNVWFWLWLLLSVTLLYFLAWTMFILFRQKKAWKAFAEARKLRYRSNSLFATPEISGVLEGYTVSLFSSEHVREDARTNRKLTGIELQLTSEMPIEGGLASGGMVDIIRRIGFREEYKPNIKGWSDAYIAASDQKPAFAAYLTEERLKPLLELMKIKNAWVIFAFRNGLFLLRVDTPHALDDPKMIDKLLKMMVKTAKVCELGKGEGARLKSQSIESDAPVGRAVLSDDDADASGLQLDEDEE